MYSTYIQNYLHGDENAVEDTIALWERDEQNRYNELIDFIDDFVNSKEYEEYLESKKNIIKNNTSTQYDDKDYFDYQEKQISPCKMYPLTLDSKKMFAFIRRFQKYMRNKEKSEFFSKQIRGIKIIKDKIEEFKKYMYLNADKLKMKKDKILDELIEEFCEIFQMDFKKLQNKHKCVRERIGSFTKMLRTRCTNRKRRYARIAKKIADDIKRERKILAKIRRGYSYKVKNNEKIMKGLEIVGLPFEGMKPIPLVNFKMVDKNTQLNKSEFQRDRWSQVSSNLGFNAHFKNRNRQSITISETSQPTIAKTGKKGKDEEPKIIFPVPRIRNYRKKITEEDIKNMSHLLQEFQILDEIMEIQYLARNPPPPQILDYDKCFLCKPKIIMFNNYQAGKKYKRILKIQNVSYQTRKFRFLKITSEDDYDTLLFSLSPLIGIQKIIPGCSFLIVLTFTPEIDASEIQAILHFISFDKATQSYQKFEVVVKCIPRLVDFKISSNNIYFGKTPIWNKRSGFKTITLTNNGYLPCKVLLKKINHLVELEEYEIDVNEENGESDNSRKSDQVSVNCTDNEDINIDQVVHEVVKELVEGVFTYFYFSSSYIILPKESTQTLKVHMRNFNYLGYYLEKYVAEVYDDNHNIIGNHEIILYGEVIGHFLRCTPTVIDLGVCIINSVYQAKLDIENMSSSTQALAVKYPSAMAEHLKLNISNVFLPPNSTRTVWIKFFPRKSIKNCTYFNKDCSVLEFPIIISVLSNNHTDIAPLKVTIYAVIANCCCLNIVPIQKYITKYPTQLLLNLGDCTIFETVKTNLTIENQSLASQIYGFIDLPKCITIIPNYGFGEIEPGAKQILKLNFHPDYHDILKKCNEQKLKDFSLKFKITVDSVCNIKTIKKAIDIKKLRKSVQLVLNELRKPENLLLLDDIHYCMLTVKVELFPDTEYTEQAPDGNKNSDESEKTLIQEEETEYTEAQDIVSDFNKITNSQITVEANCIKPLVELSAQYIELPDTPCSSYSLFGFYIKALKMEFSEETIFLRNKDLKLPQYDAWFKITADNSEIRVEPSCGILKNGDVRKIYLVARPLPPEELVKDFARSIKYAEIYRMRIKELEDELNNEIQQKKSKEKKEKKNIKEKKSSFTNSIGPSIKIPKDVLGDIEFDPNIKISEYELIPTSQDYYPAEMCYWRNLKPYTIKTKLTCVINYQMKNLHRQKDILYMDTICKVTKPDFITNLKSQRVNFGNIAINTKSVYYIMVQNIRYEPIRVKLSILDPFGPFTIPFVRGFVIPPECFLKLPIEFEPKKETQFEEYFEISSGRTVIPLILQGAGVPLNIVFTPEFSVCRLKEATSRKCDECPIKILNLSAAPVTLTIEKVFQIQGILQPLPDVINGNGQKSCESFKKGKDEKKSKDTKFSKGDKDRFTPELTNIEYFSINNFYSSTESFFEILNNKKTLTLQPNSSDTVLIGFGMSHVLERRKEDLLQDKPKKKESKSSSVADSRASEKIYYAAKYDIMAGFTFIKDITFFSCFK